MKKRNGFTLIELLAVIIILAVIALIAVPRIIELLDQARLSAAEDTTYGIAEAAESYVFNFMLQNRGNMYNGTLTFSCNKTGCILDTEVDSSYNVENLDQLKFKGTKPKSGTVTISAYGNEIEATNLIINSYICNYREEIAKCEPYKDGDEIKEEVIKPNVGTTGPTGYAQSKTVTIKYSGKGEYLFKPSVEVKANIDAEEYNATSVIAVISDTSIKAGETIAAGKWYKAGSDKDLNLTLTLEENGRVEFKVVNGEDSKETSTTITGIDRTPPEEVTVIRVSGKSGELNVKASGKDESIPLKYQYSSDNGETWEPEKPTTEATHTFKKLTSGTYQVKVKVFNGTIENNEENEMNTTVSDAVEMTTEELEVPKGEISPSGYAQSKKVTLTYTGEGVNLFRPSVEVKANIEVEKCASSTDGAYDCKEGTIAQGIELEKDTWYKVSGNPVLTFEKEGSVDFKVVDGTNYKAGVAVTVSEIDRTVPSAPNFTIEKFEDSIKVNITTEAIDEDSNIKGYQYSKDNGANWEPEEPTTEKTYTFDGLTNGTYQVKVRAINGTYDNDKQNDLNTVAAAKTEKYTIYTITFNANGGNVNPTTKQVGEGLEYGTLPEPTQDGYEFEGWYTAATDGTKVKENDKVTGDKTLYAHWKSAIKCDYKDSIALGGYCWHVIEDNGSTQTLLMDNAQIKAMGHCTGDIDPDTDCGVSGSFFQYSWEKSLIRAYLNDETETGFLKKLENAIGSDKLVKTEICADVSINSNTDFSYGGYLKSEIDSLGVTCSSYVKDKVRLITISEYDALSPLYKSSHYSLNNGGQLAPKPNITRATDSSWLYSKSMARFWTMNAYSGGGSHVRYAYYVYDNGLLEHDYTNKMVRPVITINK